MKIARIEPYHISIPYDHGAPKSVDLTGASRKTIEAVYVKVETDEGVVGWGEAFGFAGCALVHAAFEKLITPIALGMDAIDIEGTTAQLHRRVLNLGRNGVAIFALSGLDIALWDIRGKIARQPVHRLLDPRSRASVPAYASLLRIGDAQAVARVAAHARGEGYQHIKLHERSVSVVEAARAAIGPDCALMLDTNCQWSPAEALDMAKRLAHTNLAWLEEPIFPPDDYRALADLRGAGIMPIAAGENLGNVVDAQHMIEMRAVDVMQPDAAKMGGITELWKLAQYAQDNGQRVEPHSPLFGPGWIAAVHVVAAMRQDALAEFYYARLEQSPLGEAIYPRDGRMSAPTGPGLGLDVDEAVIARYRLA